MNLISAFEELDKLYESVEKPEEVDGQDVPEEATEEVTEEVANDATELTETFEDEEEIEIVEEAVAEGVPADEEVEQQLVLECANCGGLIVKTESDVKVDEETDLANVGDACQYCEESEGYKLLGTLAPYNTEIADVEDEANAEEIVEDEEDLEEGIFGPKKDSAEVNNARRKLEAEITKISGNNSTSTGRALAVCFVECFGNFYNYHVKTVGRHNVNEYKLGTRAIEVMKDMLKQLKKPTSLSQIASIFTSSIVKVHPNMKNISKYQELLGYRNIFSSMSKVKADNEKINKLLQKELLANVAGGATRHLEMIYNKYRAVKDHGKLFKLE